MIILILQNMTNKIRIVHGVYYFRYMTAREQKLHERQKHAKELLEWKTRLDAEEERVFQLEKKAIEVWEGKNKKENIKDDVVVKKKG
jgi:hypothetical protein